MTTTAPARPKGRPRLPESQRRNVGLKVWLTPGEAETIHAQARAERMSVSELLARRALSRPE